MASPKEVIVDIALNACVLTRGSMHSSALTVNVTYIMRSGFFVSGFSSLI